MAKSRAANPAMAGLVLALWSRCCSADPRVAGSPDESQAPGLSLHPPYFNLAEIAKISATDTCGQDESGRPRRELFCKLVGGPAAFPAGKNIQGQFCDYCDAADPNKAHPATNAIDGTERWWQSPSLSLGLKYDVVNITLDLGQFFHVAYVLIKFANSPRPDLWVLERSTDFGKTYMPWQYFAYSKQGCWERFGKEANARVRKDDDVICTTEYSRIVPLENGEIVISLVNGRPGANNFTHSPILREFTKATNIRLHFLRTNTLLGHLISKAQRDPTVTRRYYYSIKDISVGGQCVCNGHADICDAERDINSYRYRCECQHNTCGETCNHCCPGYNQKQWQPATTSSTNACEPCNCHGHAMDCYYDPEVEQRKESLNIYEQYQGGGVCINCQHNTAGVNCEKCLKGFYRPYGVPVTATYGCIPCSCNSEHSDGCEEGSGRCYCKLNYQGETCDRCAEGYHSFPFCYVPCLPLAVCECNLAGTLPEICDFLGRCLCRVGVDGFQCNACQPGYYSFPFCQACQCSTHGSYQGACDAATGQCECQPGFTGQQCHRCVSAANSFPHCQGNSNECDPAGTMDSYSDDCRCLQNVEGPTCSICKPLYWHLARENPYGCIECQCEASGTLSGLRECRQVDGECYCKPNVCGDSCDTCEDGYYGLEDNNYFGCQGCKCDVGGAISRVCDDLSGDCQCRRHMVGKSCNEPEKDYYLPDLHHMKFEVEDGTSPNGRGIRFGYDLQEFPGFSWRGYAQMSSVQNEVRITLNVEKSNLCLFRVILRYINPGTAAVSGHIIAYSRLRTPQSKGVVFPPSKEPAFVTVPGKSFADAFSLTPGTWIFKIMAEGVLLDYLVLLPSDYYEAPILQIPVTEACTYSGQAVTDNCLQYEHLPLDRFCCVLGSEVRVSLNRREYRNVASQQPTAKHPVMSHITGQEVRWLCLWIRLTVPQVGRYVVVLEYANEHDRVYVGNVNIDTPGNVMEAKINIYSCKYSFLCRSVVLDEMHRVAAYDLLADANFHLRASAIDFLLHKVCLIPLEDFSIEYLEPKVYCVATSGHSVLSDLGITANQITLHGRVPHLGRYVFVIQFYQPEVPTFPVHVTVDGGQLWSGSYNASFCPHIAGCRGLVMAENRIELDIPQHDISVTVKIPNGKMLVLERVLAVPADSYSYRLLQKDTVDKSFDFIYHCGGNSFYINPATSSEFCRTSARSLVAAYNDGALPCNCHRNGATSRTCDPVGGQCNCRQHIIGRQCSRCQTGYYGFPFCKPCSCGRRLCDDITGKCICPPQTVKPRCEVCVRQHFGYHPLTGCEGCNCSRKGIINPGNAECDKIVGQCKCRIGITGRRCDRCASGSYGFPNCKPCECNREGTEPDVCHPQTGVCLCKENVEGIQCDMCRPGSFYLDSANPKGCTNCFCFGATNICRSTNKRRVKSVDMRNWHLEAVDNGMSIPVTFNPGSNSVVADVQELPPSVHNLYWVAPPSYLGEKLSSYGGYLSYQVKSFGLPSEGMTLLEKRPDLQLTGHQMKLIYVDPNNPLPDKQYYGSVRLLEGNFRHASSNSLVSREELMMVLSRLDGLRIRGLYFTESQRLTLGEVGLEEVSNAGNGIVAFDVETCSCPPEYMGDSCQECSPGFYRENSGLLTGRCVPCNCHGNANRCLDGSGICINCQHNTAGEKCERCKEGYFGDATQRTCRACRCPFTSSFANGCVENGGEIQCFCKEGYTGMHCESCAPGYFGNPLKYGGYCQKCNCPDNGQLMTCERLTGECISQEPKDIDPQEDCDSCDSCVITLLKDLSTMGDELRLIKSQMQNVNASAHTLGQMKHLEDRIKELKILLSRYRTVITTHGPKVDELETDLLDLNQNVNALKEKVSCLHFLYIRSAGICWSGNVILLDQITGTSTAVTPSASGDGAKELAQAQRMINEMRNRNFEQQLTEAEKEKREAQLLLERVRTELQKHQAKNQGLIKTIRESLNEYESKLEDLRISLNEAKEQTKQAENLNGNNQLLLEDVKTGILDLLSSAEASLSQANSVFGLLQKSKEEYENLAAQLDGARKDLSEKLKSQSLSASKEPLVVRAEEHANFLQDLARKLDEYVFIFADEYCVQEGAEAKTSGLQALEGWPTVTVALRPKTLDSPCLVNKKQPYPNGEGKIIGSKICGRIETIQIFGSLCIFSFLLDDTDGLITSAKNMVKNANDITANVLTELNPIKEDVEKIKISYGSTQSSNYNKALNDANNTVKNLTNILPDLFNKITRINEQLMPIANISENINRIRELIQQARDAANKVAVPMRFNGSSGVEVRPPDNLDDLKGYTSLSLYLQRPLSRLDSPRRQTSNMFVMYLGDKDSSKDYIGMAVRDGRLICAYSLGGDEAEIRVPESVFESDTKDAILDRVQFERIYQYAKLNYIQGATSPSPSSFGPFDDSSGNSHTLLNLDPENVVFYVGGYPSDFILPSTLNYSPYEGCIELDSLNERVISLYNFKRSFNLDTSEVQPCRRYKEQSSRLYFEGTGYAHVDVTSPTSAFRRYEQTIQTTTDDGIVFFASNQDKFICLRIEKGQLVLRYKVDSQPPKEAKSQVVINNGMDQIVRFLKKMPREQVNISMFPFNSYYLGGIPASIRERFNISTPPFRGCMKNVKTSFESSPTISEMLGVSKNCPEDWKVIFLLSKFHARFCFSHSRLKMLVDDVPESTIVGTLGRKTMSRPIELGGNDFEGCISNHFLLPYWLIFSELKKCNSRSHFAVDVRTSSSRGLIFFMGDKLGNSYTALFLSKGRFVLLLAADGRKIKIKSKAKYNDGQWHTVVFSRAGKRVRLVVDGLKAREVNTEPSFSAMTESPIYLGGVPSLKIQSIPRKSFAGCLRNFNVEGKHMRTYHQNSSVLPCLDNVLENGISFFNEGGHIVIGKYGVGVVGSEHKLIVFNIRSRSLNGILIHTGSKQRNYLTVYMEGGMLTASGNNGAGEFSTSVTPRQSLCDGKWHSVAVTRKQNIVYLEVDRKSNSTTGPSAMLSTSHAQPLYFGRVPVNLATPWLPVQDVFLGCLKGVSINDKPVLVSKISDVHGVVSLQGCPVN
uniref:Laminin subunit alpha 3 n=1 Tax=Podarcis muralis TaxID=64176 RepID=A0A670IES8_PODMU